MMPSNAYGYMRWHIYFAENSKRVSKVFPGYDVLFKVMYPLTELMLGIQRDCVTGKHVTIDESMIYYMDCDVSFVQYMPANPIKHEIKVYALCCEFSAILLAYQVYVGKEDDTENSSVAICHRLCREAGITGKRVHVLYTDNWYTGIKLCQEFFEDYGWTVVRTIMPTNKNSSNSVRNSVERG